jgi:hypothetical protein
VYIFQQIAAILEERNVIHLFFNMQTQTLIHADVFFFLSSIGFVVVTCVLVVSLVYMISVLRSVRRITEKIETGIDTVGEDAKELVSDLRESLAFRILFGGRKHTKVITDNKKSLKK